VLLSERTRRAIEACYDAALMPVLWPSALQRLGESLGAESCTFSSCNAVDDPWQMPRSDAHEAFAKIWIENEPHAPDPHITRKPTAKVKGRSYILEEDVSTEEDRRTLAYYRDTARRGNRDWWAMTSFVVEGRSWWLPLYRGAGRGPFTTREARYFMGVGPHLARIIALAEKFSGVEIAAGVNLLDRLGRAAIVIDRDGIACSLNAEAERLLGPDLRLLRGRLSAGDRASNRRLQALLAAAGPRSARPEAMPPVPAVLDRDGVPWLLCEALPVTAFGRSLFNAGRCVLILTDLSASPPRRGLALRAAFGLTPAEARLAGLIADGIGIDEAAAVLGIGRETVRTQLKAAFAKTGTRSQAALAALGARLRP
jgi:DNA-binding CsgD family transcriptional regulator